jgi:hypothetical protein
MRKTNQPKDIQRFTADEIVRAIEAVERTGLAIRGVEITQSGSIKIETGPRQQQSSRAATAPNAANVQAEPAKKKQA